MNFRNGKEKKMKIKFYDELNFPWYSGNPNEDIKKLEFRCGKLNELVSDYGNYHYPENFDHDENKLYVIAWYPITCSSVHFIGEVDPGEKPEWWDKMYGSEK